MLIGMVRYLRGFVTFEICGRYPERFLNIALRSHVTIWGTRREQERLFASMYAADYRRIRGLARRSEVRLRIVERQGMPVLLHRYQSRVGVAVGGLMFALTVFVMSLFLWSVDITGLERISESELRDALHSHGVYVGAFQPGLDYPTIAREMMLDIDEIGWMAINVRASSASVEVKEEQPAPDVTDTSVPANIKASCDGTIVEMRVGEGLSYITEGSGVVAGQLLVGGVMTDDLGGVRLVRSSAEILARTHRTASFSLGRDERMMLPTGERSERLRVRFLTLELPLTAHGVDSEYAVVRRRTESPVFHDSTMPMALLRESVTALSVQSVERDDNSKKEILAKYSDLYEAFVLSSCTVEKRTYQAAADDTMTVDYTCIEDIAVTEEIGTDENTDRLPARARSDE